MKDEMVCLEPFDWRYSAAIVGLRKYLEWLGVDEEPNLIITEDTLEYNKKYLDKEDFLNLHSIWAGQELYRKGNSKEMFYNILEKNIIPVYDSARRQGYEIWDYS